MYLGINKSIEVDVTGAPAGFHKIVWYSVDLNAKQMNVTIASYFSSDAYTAGKQPMGSSVVSIPSIPGDSDNPLQFAYQGIVAPAPAADPANPSLTNGNNFSGGTLVPFPVPVAVAPATATATPAPTTATPAAPAAV